MSERRRLGLTRSLPGPASAELKKWFDVDLVDEGGPISPSALQGLLERCEVMICQLTDQIESVPTGSPLRHLITNSVGVNHLNCAGLRQQGIRISHTPAVLTEATADLTWALILSATRHLFPAAHFLRQGHFSGFAPSLFLGKALHESTLGILGMGRIGRAVAERAKGFGMRVVFHSRSETQFPGAEAVSLESLLEQSDVLSVHCPLNDSTFHLLGRDSLRAMKTDAVLVNTARGPIVDEVALVIHLRENASFIAALDVYEREPDIEAGLAEAPNAICLPHIGSATQASRFRMAEVCVSEAIAFAKGDPLRYELKADG